MLPIILISALVLLESRDVLNGFLSQPFMVSLLFVFCWGFDPYSVFTLAVAVHMIYIRNTPSGASMYPEYPFAFFITLAAFGKAPMLFEEMVTALVIIIITARITALILNKKRHFFEAHRDLLLFYKKLPNFIPALIFSFVFFSSYSFIIFWMIDSSLIFFRKFFSEYCLGQVNPEFFLFIILIPVFVYVYNNLRHSDG
ncbi:MAG: hypothetical protein R6V47_00850 [Candidatus Delongbacteria bacterium]